MGSKRPSCTLFDTSSNINTSDRKLHPGGNVSRDPSPRPAMTALSDRERDGGREDNRRREREAEKVRDKTRPKEADPRDRYYDRERAPVPRPREGDRGWSERGWREEDVHARNGRPLSSVEKEAEREVVMGMRKGDTFPRIRKNSRERGRGPPPAGGEMDDERGERRQRDRQRREEMDAREREREREWARQRDRDRARERDEVRGQRPKDERQNTGRRHAEDEKGRDRYQEFQDGRRDGGDTRDRRDRDATRKRDKLRPDMGHREGRVPSPRRRRDWEEDERRRRKEGRRDTRSEGDSDEREMRRDRERERQREELQYQQSRSEGDKRNSAQREREDEEDRRRHRERCRAREEDRTRRWEEEKSRERAEPRPQPREADRDTREDRRRQQRHRDPQEGGRVREVEPRLDDPSSRGRRPSGERTPAPRAQSSGEWSTTESDRDVEEQRVSGERRQREKKRSERAEREREERGEAAEGGRQEQRRMWLEPRWGENSREDDREGDGRERRVKSESGEDAERARQRARHEGHSGERVRAERERGPDMDERAPLSSSDGGVEEESDGEEAAGSGGGSELGWRRDGDRLLSGEEGFVTVSSGGDDEDHFQDCREFWDGGEEDPSKASKYVFCVIGQSLPCSATKDKSPSRGGSAGGAETENPYDEVTWEPPQDDHGPPPPRRDHKYPAVNNRDSKSSGEVSGEDAELPTMREKKENPYAEIGPINRDSQTEKLLTEWRQRNRGDGDKQSDLRPPSLPTNPYDDCFPGLDFEQIQPILDGLHAGAMSPEEVEAIRIRLSGAWSISQEPKRHSQAPHLKWAKNVVREILGQSEDQEASAEPQEEEKEVGEVEEKASGGSVEIHGQPGEPPVDEMRLDEEPEMELEELDVEEVEEVEEEEEEEEEGSRDDEDDRSRSWGEVELRNVLDTIERRKRNSKFFNAAQLYQQYSEAAQNFEILRQARSDAVSLAGETAPSPAPSPPPARRPLPPLPASFHHQTPNSLSYTGSVTSVQSLPLPQPPRSEQRPSSPRLSVSLGQSSSLWRELPGVRNSSELEELSEDERRLQEVRFEVVTSEASYCRSLDIVVEHFVKSKQLGALLTTQDRNWLFSRLADVRAISHSFLSKLEERVESNIMSFTVCDIIARHCQRFRMVYVPYLTNQSYQDATYQRLMNENPGFKRIVEKLERSPVCQRLPFRSFLVLPFQRITRIKLLVQNIVKRTTPGTPEAINAIKALKLVEKLIQESNDSITQMKSIESLVSLSAKVDFECRTLPLISQSRRLVREGLVTELIDFSLKDTERNIYVHLFNDYLLLSLQKEGGRFTVIDHSPVSDLRVENCRVKLHSLQKNLFRLHMAHKALLLRTDTQSEKLRWISALSRPHPEIDFSAAQDFPQMQCVRSCVAQQPDELSLEKADIILVHQQSSDHWVEGTRLSDRHRGWVPESHLETISNSKVRNRNLSDAQKLTTATAAV